MDVSLIVLTVVVFCFSGCIGFSFARNPHSRGSEKQALILRAVIEDTFELAALCAFFAGWAAICIALGVV